MNSDISGTWMIESLSQFTLPPSKEEMERLIPSIWPLNWEEISRTSSPRFGEIILGHLNPASDTNMAYDHDILGFCFGFPKDCISTIVGEKINPKRYDYIGGLDTTFQDKELLSINASIKAAENDLAKVEGMLSELKDKQDQYREFKNILKSFKPQVKQLASIVKETALLGEKARMIIGSSGRKIVTSVFLGPFTLFFGFGSRGIPSLLVKDYIEPGSKEIHSIACWKAKKIHKSGCKCEYCRSHNPCSTLKKEGFIHREELEDLLCFIFSRIKGKKTDKEAMIEILGEGSRIENPEKGFEIKKGDGIKTKNAEVKIKDNLGNEIILKSNTELKLSEEEIDMKLGEIIAKIKKLPRDYDFKFRTPQAVCGVRGTTFVLNVSNDLTTITVIEGEVEFSDLKGNKVIVKENQCCICSKEGIRKPSKIKIKPEKGGD